MAESNFGIFGAAAADIARGVTAGFTPPNGGGNFIFGFNSKVTGDKTVGLYYNASGFAPLRDDEANATGGSVRGAVQRGRSVAAVGFSTGLFMCLQATTEDDKAYVLGLSDNDPSAIVLAKVALSAGLDEEATTTLRTSSETFTWETWLHLRLDVIVNPNGDVVLKCFQNDLETYPVTSPNWEAIPGMTDFIDDALGINSESSPMAGGYGGWYFMSSISGARGFIDQFEMYRQM
jgi:hypothetical protein